MWSGVWVVGSYGWGYGAGGKQMDQRREKESPEPRKSRIEAIAEAFAQALLAADVVAAEIAIREAMDASLGTSEIDERVITPAMWLVGELWERGEISVADEHIATEITVRVLALQREAQRVVQSRGGRRVMLATPAGELHVVALRMVENLLRGAGYEVVMLGADVPAIALAAAARRLDARVVCMSLTVPGRADQVLNAIDEVRRAAPSAAFVVGGRGLSAGLQSRPEVHVCGRVSEAVEAVDAMVKRAGLN
jgi:MerR family transcriptional regulator, light-induced transcriptional regulator